MSKTINKPQLLVEFISVVFAVILALILNSWRESLAVNENLKKVKETIVSEIIQNDSLIKESHKYRGQLLDDLYNNQHLLFAIPIADFQIDINDNVALANFFKTALIFSSKDYYERVLVLQEGSDRVLVLDNKVFDIQVEQDTLSLFGVANIQLKTPDLSNRSYHLAQATETLVEMDIQLVEKLSRVSYLLDTYVKANDNALAVLYGESQKGIIAAIEDMYTLEADILKANADLLSAIEKGIY